MADERYFQAVSGQWGWYRIATTLIGTAEKGCEVDYGPQTITFGSARTEVGYIENERAYLRRGLWDSRVEVKTGKTGLGMNDPWHPYLVDVSPIAALADPSYILEDKAAKEIVYHNAVKGTLIVGSGDEGCLIELDEREFKNFANAWNVRHCEGWLGQNPTPPSIHYSSTGYGALTEPFSFDGGNRPSIATYAFRPGVGFAIWPPLKKKGLTF